MTTLKELLFKPRFEDKANIKFISDYLDYSIVPIVEESEEVKPMLNLLVDDLENWVFEV